MFSTDTRCPHCRARVPEGGSHIDCPPVRCADDFREARSCARTWTSESGMRTHACTLLRGHEGPHVCSLPDCPPPKECDVRFSYNNGSANALGQDANVIARCTLLRGHSGPHDRTRL